MLDKKLLDDLKSVYQLDESTLQNLNQFPTIALVLDNIQSFPSSIRPTQSIIKRVIALHEQLNLRHYAFTEYAIQKCLTSVPSRLVLEHYAQHQLPLPDHIDELFDSKRLPLLFDLINQHQHLLTILQQRSTQNPQSFFSQPVDDRNKMRNQCKIFGDYFFRNDQFNCAVIEETLHEIKGEKNNGALMSAPAHSPH